MVHYTRQTTEKEMKLREEANVVYDDNDRALVALEFFRGRRYERRLPACTIGEYFAVLTWLMDQEDA